ncbi:hypothetical protein [Alienimonas californiensis]|uniref:Uncharacterized protein n=1 Tax=Alienimonas californiensis TaxID=2527989 RepID=A0A517P8U0_9PLAN|nr:hypothetical protein [Alienimonas californiensis]QDT15794.1 hypothetical protein CA12_18880 [Alienimonas californiensis]
MSLWEGELTTVGIWTWWFVITTATVVFGIRGWRRGAPGGRWALLAGVLGLGTGLAPWATGLAYFLAGRGEPALSEAMTAAAYFASPVLWAASQLSVIAAVATMWRMLDRERPPRIPAQGGTDAAG